MKPHLKKSLQGLQRRAAQIEQGNYLDIADLLGRPHVDAKAFKGDVWGVVAPSGGGKTAWMIQTAVYAAGYKDMATLYISPEVADYNVHRRALQMLEQAGKYHVINRAKDLYIKHQDLLNKIHVHTQPEHHTTIEQLIMDAAAANAKRFDMLVIDHMKLMKWQGDMRMEIEAFCSFVKQFAETNQLIIWLINQVPKSAMTKYGNVQKRLEITDVSEASGIYQILDGGIVINTPFGSNHSARRISIGKGRDLNAADLQDIPFRQNPNYFIFEPVSEQELAQHAPGQNITKELRSNTVPF